MLVTVLLLGLLAVATITDLRDRKVYNWTTYPGILAALAISTACSLTPVGVSERQLVEWIGWRPLPEGLAGFAACGGLMLVCFVMFKIGGGDVKLMAMLGAFLGIDDGLRALLWTFLLGGCLGLSILIWRVGPLGLAGKVFRQVMWTLRLGQWSPLAEEERVVLREPLHLAPSALAAVVIVRFSLV
jgi:prepilin peptidase CpaA